MSPCTRRAATSPAVAFAPWRPYEERVRARPDDGRIPPGMHLLVAAALTLRLVLALPATAAEPAARAETPATLAATASVGGRHGAVAAEHPRAAEIGAEM